MIIYDELTEGAKEKALRNITLAPIVLNVLVDTSNCFHYSKALERLFHGLGMIVPSPWNNDKNMWRRVESPVARTCSSGSGSLVPGPSGRDIQPAKICAR